jgi:hypothetical protein
VRIAAVIVACACAIAAPLTRADQPASKGLRPYIATYKVAFKGMGGGHLELKLVAGPEPGHWHFETIPHPVFLARIWVSGDSREQGDLIVTDAGVVPQYYRYDGGSDHENDVELKYDWANNRVTGNWHGRPLDLALEPGAQDAMSVRAAIQVDLLAGRIPKQYMMIDDAKLRTFEYHLTSSAEMPAPGGPVQTDVYESRAKGEQGGRYIHYWYAPSLDYLPVRVEQFDSNHKSRLLMVLTALKFP